MWRAGKKGSWLLATSCWLMAFGYELLATKSKIHAVGSWIEILFAMEARRHGEIRGMAC
jgi:hypothetical protein